MVDIKSLYLRARKGYLKNYREYAALRGKLYPQFVFDNNLKTINNEIPVFTLHSVNPSKFEKQLKFLVSNGYSALKADDFYERLIGSKPIEEKAIVLTFDDGWKNLYTVAYPLLKKYNLAAICFLVPSLISKNGDDQTKDEERKKNMVPNSLPDSDNLCNWKEINEMHQSGIIDFQSHSMHHCLIFTSQNILDFFSPNFDSYALNFDVPLIRNSGEDNFMRNVDFGIPIYEHTSRFSGKKRYFDDEKLRQKCADYVSSSGGILFFRKLGWRRKLLSFVENYNLKNKILDRFENEDELRESIFNEFRDSKILIEQKIPGKKVRHFCYPWWIGSEFASEISKEAGYLSNYWGVLKEKRTNKKGDDPTKISRILSDDFIYRLPGNGRKSIKELFFERYFGNYKSILSKHFIGI